MKERIITITINETTKAVSYQIDGREVTDLLGFSVEYKSGETLSLTLDRSVSEV